jgi:hypothetical protein
LSPPALRTNPPPCNSGRVPCAIPFLTNWRYLLRASLIGCSFGAIQRGKSVFWRRAGDKGIFPFS